MGQRLSSYKASKKDRDPVDEGSKRSDPVRQAVTSLASLKLGSSNLKVATRPQNTTQPDPSRSTLRHIPPEIIFEILEQGAWRSEGWNMKDRYRLLYALSLVCKSWSDEARVLLWRKIYVGSEHQGLCLLKSKGLGRYQTGELKIFGAGWEGGVSQKTMLLLLARMAGVKSLALSDYGASNERMYLKLLCLDNLKDLESLTLRGVYLHQTDSTVKPPFNLRHIDLRHDPSDKFTFDVSNFPPVSATLLPLWTTSTKLTSIRIRCSGLALDTVLRTIPSRLHTLAIGVNYSDLNFFFLLSSALDDAPSLESLRQVEFIYRRRSAVTAINGGMKFVDDLERRGVRVLFGVR